MDTQKVEIKVGPFSPDGTFLGEFWRFTGEDVASWTEHISDPQDNWTVTYTLYKCPGGYRLHVYKRSEWYGVGSRADLYPSACYEDLAAVREDFPDVLAAMNYPDVVDID